MSYIVVDVESDGPCPVNRSMVCFGAVLAKDANNAFMGKTRPIYDEWDEGALAVSGYTRDEHERFDEPGEVMGMFAAWLYEVSDGKPTFISDNPAFDWQWINYYFHKYIGRNPFGFSARRIGDLYCGMMMDAGKNPEWKRKYRKTAHDHNPVNDARGNAEALIAMKDLGLRMRL